jgi:heme/copper-type cytochrome/quinol oxidase subunit 2
MTMYALSNRTSLTRALVWGLLLLLVFQSVALACPTCKDSLDQNDPTRSNMVRGYFWSILFMMSMPFLILTGLGLLFYWEVRKAKAAQLLGPAVGEEPSAAAGS